MAAQVGHQGRLEKEAALVLLNATIIVLMSIQLLIFIIITLANLALGTLVLLRNPKNYTNRLFMLLVIALSVWMTASFFEDVVTRTNMAVQLLKIDYGIAPIIGILFYEFTNNLINGPIFKNKFVHGLVVMASLVAAVLGLVFVLDIPSIHHSASGVEFNTTSWEYLYDGLVLLPFVLGVVSLFLRNHRAKGKEKSQTRIIMTGLTIWISLALVANLVLASAFNMPTLSRLGIYATIIYIGFTSYAIIKHRLFDIRLVVARTLAYALLLVTLTGLYVAGAFGITTLAFSNQKIATGQEAVFVGLAIVLAFAFQPLRRFFERITDKIFFRDKYDSQQLLNEITQVLAQEIDLQKVLDRTLTMIAQAVRVNFGQYLIFDEGKVYKVEHYGRLPDKLITTPELKVLNRSMVVADELEAGRRKEVMDEHGIRLSLALRTKDEFVGFLLLGDKLSGDIYSTQDIELFEILANELAVAIVNAKAYEEIAQFNITLQDKVNQATSRLRVANRHLKDLDKAKDEFISMASHQLRTPLTTIKGYISMLQEGDAGKITKDQRQFLEYAYDGSERMVNLISDLLNVSRMNSGKFMIDRTNVDPVAMVADEIRQLVSHAEAKQLKLVWQPPKDKLPNVQLDENKTRQVIMNFIDNAVYYTKTGSVTVTLNIVDGQLELRVTDTGIGVPPEAQKKLFSKFFRAGNAQQVRPDGTGLGLYLAKRVVEDQGGTIIFESTEGKGSTFGFRLPIKPAAGNEKPAVAAPATVSVKSASSTKVKVAVGK